MSTVLASIDVRCPFSAVIERIARYFKDLGFPSLLRIHRVVVTRFVVTRDATDRTWRHDAIAVSWRSLDGPYPVFTGLITARRHHDRARLIIDGRYRPSFGLIGAAFDLIVGTRIATATALLDELRMYAEEPFQARCLSDVRASSKKFDERVHHLLKLRVLRPILRFSNAFDQIADHQLRRGSLQGRARRSQLQDDRVTIAPFFDHARNGSHLTFNSR